MTEKLSAAERFRLLTQRPSIADAALKPVQDKIFEVVDEKIKPALTHPGDISGKRYLYVDPRIDTKKLW